MKAYQNFLIINSCIIEIVLQSYSVYCCLDKNVLFFNFENFAVLII